MKKLTIVILISCLSLSGFAQFSEFSNFNTSRYARVISLANSFTGLADDIETVYYNSAGLANLNYYAFSYTKGQGYTFIITDYIADDFALIIPTFNTLGFFALTLDRLSFNDIELSENLYRLHFARTLFSHFSIGASLNYYYIHSKPGKLAVGAEDDDGSGHAFDISLSALYCLPITCIPGIYDETRIGFQLQNVLDTDMNFSGDLDSNNKHQVLRAGLSTIITPEFPEVMNLNLVTFLIAADAVFYGSKYSFEVWQPNFGLELTLLEIFKFRYGRENEKQIKDGYDYSPQHPVKRYGAGITLPLHKWISGFSKMEITFDYSNSDWDKIDESKSGYFTWGGEKPIREAYSVKLYFQY